MSGRVVRAAGWLLALLTAATSLRLAGAHDLAAPPLGAPDQLTAWVEARSPAVVAIALVRLVAEVGAWYLLGLSLLHAAAHVVRPARGRRVIDALTLPGIHRVVQAGLGLGLVAASSVAGPHADAPAPGSATMVPVLGAGTATARPLPPHGGTAAMRPVDHADAAAGVDGVPPAGTATMQPRADPAPPGARHAAVTPTPATWTVTVGESLWSIAHDVLADAWGRSPGAHEVEPYWRRLVEANRARLVDASDPDLIHPGQVFEVPAAPAVPA